MNEEDIPKKYFINSRKKVVKYIPEKTVTEIKYDKGKWKKLFPPLRKNIDYSKLRLTNIAEYSMAKPFISEHLKNILLKYLKLFKLDSKKMTITETNGGVGGLTIRLLTIFDNINVVEINPKHVELIKNNLNVYKSDAPSKNINIYNNDYLDILYDLNQDIIISDPPWGGYSYSKYDYMKLGLNNINISYIVNQLYKKNKFKIFILLAMRNFDIQNFINTLIADNISIRNMGKHYYIIIFGKDLN